MYNNKNGCENTVCYINIPQYNKDFALIFYARVRLAEVDLHLVELLVKLLNRHQIKFHLIPILFCLINRNLKKFLSFTYRNS